MANVLRIKRRSSGDPGSPASLANAELAYNEVSDILFYGKGSGGAGGLATTIEAIAGSGAYLNLSGTQTVSGDKTFTGPVDLGSFAQAITKSLGDNSTAVATTAYVDAYVDQVVNANDLNIVGDTGSGSIDHATESLGILGGTGLSSSVTGNDITIDLDDTTVNAGSYGSSTEIPTFTVDAQGRITAASTTSVATTLSTSADSGSGSIDLLNQGLTVSGGTGLSSVASSQEISINLDDTSVNAGLYGTASAVATFTVDAQGRLTAAADVSINITASQVSDFDAQVQTNRLDQLTAPNAAVSFNGQKITNVADPIDAQDAATKAYVDATKQGLDVKDSVRVATTADITLGGTQTVDGISLVAGDRVLVKNQSTASENGIYVVASNAWSRSEDADIDSELTPGAFTFVEEGIVNADSGWVLTTDGDITIGTTGLTFTQFSGAGQITAGNGLTKSGNTLDVVTADAGRIVVNADSIDLATTGITPGTYQSVTVDAYGRISAATNPTTIAGYGITDAQPLDATLTALAGVDVSADELIYATGSDQFSTTTLTAYGRDLIDSADAAAARSTLGAVIGTDVQAYAADLDNLSGMQAGASAALALLTQSEVEILDGATVSTAELNIVDGSTAATATTLELADRIVVNDSGTMVQVALSDLVAFFEDSNASGFELDGGTF